VTNISSEASHPTDSPPISPKTAGNSKSSMGGWWLKGIGVVVWVGLVAAYWRYTTVNDLTPLETVQQLVAFLAASSLGILVYILLYILRPVVFFPATLLTLAGGYLYGPVWGTLLVVVASNLSSLGAYTIGRFFGNGSIGEDTEKEAAQNPAITTADGSTDAPSKGVVQKYAARMRENSFETVLIMRFIFLPYDLVSYVSGLLRVDWKGFLLATALGSIPGTISFVLFGASIEGDFTGELPSLNVTTLVIAALMFAVSLGLSRWFKKREGQQTAS